MGCTALCLVLLGLLAGSTYGQSCSLITSNVLRMDSEETFLVDGHGTALDGDIVIQDFPNKKFIIAQGRISVNNDNGFLGTSKFLVPSTNLDKDPEKKQFVYVIVRSAPCNLEKVVLVSYQSGYIFIQTDKPLYTPGSTVLYRIFSMNPDLKPINKPLVVEVLAPDNVIVKTNAFQRTNIKGIISGNYKITDPASVGTWTLVAKFEDTPADSFTTHFDVKEYVLPSFEVKIMTDEKNFYISDQDLRVKIHAKYLYGEPVNGMAYVLFSASKEGERKSLPETLQRVQIENGEGRAVLKREDLMKYFQQEKDMLQWRLSVSATVITDSGSDMVETELTDIPMATSPYQVRYIKTSKFFKPGMPMDLMVHVTHPDGSPAQLVPVVVEPGPVRGRTQKDGTVQRTITTRADISSLPITVTTEDPLLLPTQQASAAMTATAYQPRGGNFLHLSIGGQELKIGEKAAIHFLIRNTDPAVQNQITHFNYIILNKGRIMRTGRQARAQGQTFVNFLLPITPEFIPSFRMVAYYVVPTGAGREIVADSIWVDVEDTCMGTLTLSGYRTRSNPVHQPGDSVKLKLTADHLASVWLVAVDKGINVLNNKEKFSQTKVWDSVGKYDTGCTVGGGADAAGVFYDAGLALGNAFHGSTPQRSEPLCQVKLKRRRRDIAALFQTKYSIARSDGDLDFVDDADIISRSEFPESWLWKIETMNERPVNGISSKILNVAVKDSLTTWEVMAVSLSEGKGICVSKPHNIRASKPFFIDLRIPYSIVRNEQVEIRAVLNNYGNSKQRVRMEWTYNENFCSLATSKSKFRQYVDVKPASSIAVPYIIIPSTLGYHDVEVKVSGQGISDGVVKKLKVVPFSGHHETEKESQCKNFDLSLKVQDEPLAKALEGTLSTVSLTICTKHLKAQDSAMATMQISMMSGFEADVNDLTKLKRGVDRYISNFEINKGAADKSTVVLHIDKISHTEEKCLKFNLHQYFKMGLIQPASVTVYDYYSPENRCTKFYHVDEDSKLLGKICVGEVCRCAEANCVMQQRLDNVDDIKRLESACAHGVDYVYKTTLSEIKEENNYFTYVMTITLIIKEGTDVVQVNEKRDFLSHAKCRNALNLVVGQDYMVWGVSKDLWNPGDGFFYMVTRDTWVERWPNARECQQRQYSKQCDELNNFSDELQLQGCPQ